VQDKLWVDRLEATIEAHIMATAQVREACTIPGTSVRTAWLCRDKPSMKEALREAGVPTAASAAVAARPRRRRSPSEVGFPLILKPRSGAGASGTVRVDDPAAWSTRWGSSAAGRRVDRRRGVHRGPRGLLRHDHGQRAGGAGLRLALLPERAGGDADPVDLAAVHLHQPDRLGAGVRRAARDGRRVIAALGIETSATHMEWFFGPKGLKFSEIGCRPPGVGAWDLYSAGNEIDLYRAWANAIAGGDTGSAPSRRYASGIVALRPGHDGRISGLHRGRGAAAAVRRVGHRRAPAAAGHRDPGVEAGYMANAYVRMRHPDYDTLHACSTRWGARCTSTPREGHPAGAAAQADGGRGDAVAAPGGPVATITAGWQEREADDDELSGCSASATSTSGCTGGGSTCRSATRDSPPPSGGCGESSRRSRTSTCCGWTTRCGGLRRAAPQPAMTGCGPRRWPRPSAAVRELDAAHLRRVNDIRGEFYQACGRTTGR
jgi:hypothetical protein